MSFKNKNQNKRQGGFVKMVILIIIALIILGYMGFDIRKAVESPVAKSNIEYTKEVVVYTWNTYLKGPIKYILETLHQYSGL